MKHSIKGLFVILFIVMSFFSVQSVFAETVEGDISSISTSPCIIEIDGVEVHGVKINYLAKYEIYLEEGDEVSIEYYEYQRSDGTIINKACAIEVGDATIQLRDDCP